MSRNLVKEQLSLANKKKITLLVEKSVLIFL